MYVIVKDGDTVATLAEKYLGSDDYAVNIINANRLDPPFIVSDPNFQTSAAATGTLQFTLAGTGPVTLPAGTVVQTDSGPSGEVRSYTTNSAVTLAATGSTATVTATCTQPGPLGNVPPFRVTVVNIANVIVTNITAMTGGYSLHVLRPGDRIYIPDLGTNEGTQPNPTPREPLRQYDLGGGVGILVTPLGGFLWGSNDLQLQYGYAEIVQEVIARLRTLRGSLWYYPAGGSILPALIGSAFTPGDNMPDKIAVLAEADAVEDDRIASAQFAIQPGEQPGWVVLTGTLILKTGAEQNITVPVSI